jgi:hypothetical protein
MGFTMASEQAVSIIYPSAYIPYISAAIGRDYASVKVYKVGIVGRVSL